MLCWRLFLFLSCRWLNIVCIWGQNLVWYRDDLSLVNEIICQQNLVIRIVYIFSPVVLQRNDSWLSSLKNRYKNFHNRFAVIHLWQLKLSMYVVLRLFWYLFYRFYIENICYLQDSVSVELYYLQARHSVYKGVIECDSTTVFELAAYSLQAAYANITRYVVVKYLELCATDSTRNIKATCLQWILG